MALSFKKDVLMNWIEEIGKFLRIWTEGHDAFTEPTDLTVFEGAYEKFFEKSRGYFLELSESELTTYSKEELQAQQLHPLALTFLFDGLNAKGEEQQNLLRKAKLILNLAMTETASFSFQDYQYLSMIDRKLNNQ
nr:hypothetical protein [uncultured Sphingobacterium sp.]